jgi:hypothetical protein
MKHPLELKNKKALHKHELENLLGRLRWLALSVTGNF